MPNSSSTLKKLRKITYPHMLKKIIKKINYEFQFNNTNYWERFSDKFFKTYYQKLLRSKINKLSPIICSKNPILTLCMLSSHRNFSESIASIYSFSTWEKNIAIHYHEDGSLTEKEIDKLKKIFIGITIFRRKDQNIKTFKYLSERRLHKCADLRSFYIFSLRLFDFIIEKKTNYILQMDSDVLFFKKPAEILDIVYQKTENGCYNKDVVNAYTFQPEVLSLYVNNMISQFNAGLLLHNFDEDLFNFVENIIAKQPESFNSWHLEQTLLAMYASKMQNFLKLPVTYDLGRIERKKNNDLTSEHYVHSTGYDFHRDFIYKLFPIYQQNW